MSKFKVGDRVVPRSKSYGCSLEECGAWKEADKRGQPYLTVCLISEKKLLYCGLNNGEHFDPTSGIFLESDLILYEEVSKAVEKPPVYYTLPKPKEIPAIIDLRWTGVHEYDPLRFTPYESEYPIQPDYKGFYEFIMANDCDTCAKCPCFGEFCKRNSGVTCSANLAAYAENKFIKGGK